MSEPIDLEQMPTGGKAYSQCPYVGPLTINTPRGEIQAEEVPGLTTIELRGEGGKPKSVVVMLYDPVSGLGFYSQMSADSARNAGASLIHLANRLDGRAPD